MLNLFLISASKPGVWTPGQSQGGHATAPKPFSPTVQPSPPAPGGPRGGAAPKPTGVGAVRAKKGEASMFMSGDAAPGGQRTPVCNSCGMNIRYDHLEDLLSLLIMVTPVRVTFNQKLL